MLSGSVPAEVSAGSSDVGVEKLSTKTSEGGGIQQLLMTRLTETDRCDWQMLDVIRLWWKVNSVSANVLSQKNC